MQQEFGKVVSSRILQDDLLFLHVRLLSHWNVFRKLSWNWSLHTEQAQAGYKMFLRHMDNTVIHRRDASVLRSLTLVLWCTYGFCEVWLVLWNLKVPVQNKMPHHCIFCLSLTGWSDQFAFLLDHEEWVVTAWTLYAVFTLEEQKRSSVLPSVKGNKPKKLIQILFFLIFFFFEDATWYQMTGIIWNYPNFYKKWI